MTKRELIEALDALVIDDCAVVELETLAEIIPCNIVRLDHKHGTIILSDLNYSGVDG